MSYSVVVINRLLLLFILPFVPIIGATPADKSQLSRWFDSTFRGASAVKAAAAVIKVRAGGGGDFKTVSDAINSIPSGNKQRVVVSIGPGNYTEKITIPTDKPFITLYGHPNNMPVLVFDGTAEKYGTVDSATLTADADHFMAVNLKIVNSALRPDGKTGGSQAVALRVGGDAAAFYNCKIYGYQDTLFDYNGRHLFKDCYVEGTVDFIFGGGRSMYLNSEIHVIPGDPLTFITAHARSNDSEATGFVFVHCSVTGVGQTAFLGRSWFPYARVVYAYTNLSDVVNPLGWSDNMRPETNRKVFFGEFKNEGPGSKLDKRVTFAKQLKEEEAKAFITLDYIQASSWLLPPPKL